MNDILIHEELTSLFDVDPLYLLPRKERTARKGKIFLCLIGVRFDVERSASGLARNAAGDVFALAGCGVCLNKHTLHRRHARNARRFAQPRVPPSDRSYGKKREKKKRKRK